MKYIKKFIDWLNAEGISNQMGGGSFILFF